MNGKIISEHPFILDLQGSTLEYPSHSEADYALVSILAMDPQDRAVIDEEFRQSVLMREKWERLGAGTIEKVLKTIKIQAPQAQQSSQQLQNYGQLLNELSVDRGSWIEQNVPKSGAFAGAAPGACVLRGFGINRNAASIPGPLTFKQSNKDAHQQTTSWAAEKITKPIYVTCRTGL
jgi:hypothetical protein